MEIDPLMAGHRPTCDVVESHMSDIDNGPYVTYGILYRESDLPTGQEPFLVADISTDRALIKQMADLFVRCHIVSRACLIQAITALIS